MIYLKFLSSGSPLLKFFKNYQTPSVQFFINQKQIERLVRQNFPKYYCISTSKGLLTAQNAYLQRQAGYLLYAL